MKVDLTPDRERRRLEILAALDEAEASLARGEGTFIIEESMKALAERVKQRGRARLAVERATTRRRSTATRGIDFSDVPESSEKQLRAMRRIRSRPSGDRSR